MTDPGASAGRGRASGPAPGSPTAFVREDAGRVHPQAPATPADVAERIALAAALGTPLDLLTARVVAATLQRGTRSPHARRLSPVVDAFVEEGVLSAELRTWPEAMTEVPIDLVPWVVALVDVLDTAPAGPAAYLSYGGMVSGWVDLVVDEDHLLDQLRGLRERSLLELAWRVEARTGLDDFRDGHLAANAYRDTDHGDDVWGLHWLARQVAAHGDSFTALFLHEPPVTHTEVADRWVGPVEDVRGVVYGIGLRDGWFTELAALARHGLLDHVHVDVDGIWARYRERGWAVYPAPSGSCHLYRPYGRPRAELPRLVDLPREIDDGDPLDLL